MGILGQSLAWTVGVIVGLWVLMIILRARRAARWAEYRRRAEFDWYGRDEEK